MLKDRLGAITTGDWYRYENAIIDVYIVVRQDLLCLGGIKAPITKPLKGLECIIIREFLAPC